MMSITNEDLKKIESMIDRAAKKSAEKIADKILIANKMAEQKRQGDFKNCEKILYKYPTLKLRVAMDEEILKDAEALITPPRKSTDVLRYSKSSGGTAIDIEDYTRSRKASMLRTNLELQRIEKALETVKDDEYYQVIELKYGFPPEDFDWKDKNAGKKLNEYKPLSIEEIAAMLEVAETTVKRHRKRIVEKLIALLM